MKKILLLLLFIPVIGFSQNVTTELEYNYLTQGYKSTYENGEDVKAGYEIINFKTDKIKDFTIDYSSFNYLQSKTTKAVLIVVKKDGVSKDKYVYMCLPFNNPELMKKFYTQANNLGLSMIGAFNHSIYILLSENLDLKLNKKS